MADDDITPKKKSKLKWIILIVLLLLVGGGAAAAWFFVLQDMLASSDNGSAKTEVVETAPAKAGGVAVSMPVFTTNLADPLGQRFIRLTIDIEVADVKAVEELTRQNARARDSILLLLSSKTYADIATTESKLMLKSEITDRLNAIVGAGKVYQVFITDLIIQ
jgi:flagellar FliL protein